MLSVNNYFAPPFSPPTCAYTHPVTALCPPVHCPPPHTHTQVAGTSGKVKLDGGSDDEGAACETYGAAIQAALGTEHYCQVLSKLYIARSDVQYLVRNTALHM